MRLVAQEQKNIKKQDLNPSTKVRISIAKHNVQRVEATFHLLTKQLLADGLSEEEINSFYSICVDSVDRLTSTDNIGSLIGRHDDIKDIKTPACSDGILMTPMSIMGIIVTVPTVYEPSGEASVSITSGQEINLIPMRLNKSAYVGFDYVDSLENRSYRYLEMLDRSWRSNGAEYQLPNQVDDIVLKLGRETASIGYLIADFGDLPISPNNLQKSIEAKRKFLKVATEAYMERRYNTHDQLRRAHQILKDSTLSQIERDKVDFYILLTKTYVAEMDFLADEITSNSNYSPDLIAEMARELRKVGRDNVAELPKIIEGLKKRYKK
ncbi:MAG: hypothetical protein WCO06_05790 [Candidatus Roizmanbacteria bacterium]